MPAGLARFLRVADGGMMAYWLVMVFACLKLVSLPHAAMYAGYGSAPIDAWNWSFAPLDVAFALTGFAALRAAAAGRPSWRVLAVVSLVLTMCAGGMAVSYWALAGDFSLAWWLPNCLLLGLPLLWLPGLMAQAGRSEPK